MRNPREGSPIRALDASRVAESSGRRLELWKLLDGRNLREGSKNRDSGSFPAGRRAFASM